MNFLTECEMRIFITNYNSISNNKKSKNEKKNFKVTLENAFTYQNFSYFNSLFIRFLYLFQQKINFYFDLNEL